MAPNVLVAIATIVALGIGAQWVAWRFHLPAILLLLLAGFGAGTSGLLDPHLLFGDLLEPVVSASVAIVLFEGGLSLNLHELRGTGSVLWRLVTLGAVATWAAIAAAAHWIIGLDFGISLLVGAILIVSGPTVIGPLLRHVRPVGRVAGILRWEGILIDPIGALLAVLVFDAVILGEPGEASSTIARGVLETAAVGTGVGFGAAALMVIVLKRYMIPDFLHNAVSLALVIGAFTAADAWVDESGLLAVTVMGIVLANQRFTPVRHIIEFKETLRVLLISSLFIVLAAQIEIEELTALGAAAPLFLGTVLIARPIAVWLSTIGSRLEGRERTFLAVVSPRGIVAAAVSSVFALRLQEAGHEDADVLAPLTFMVIVGTIVVTSGWAGRVARKLDLSDTSPQGALVVGANPVARAIAEALHAEEVRVVLVDNDFGNISAARMKGLPVSFRSILAEEVGGQTELGGIGRLLALTPNDELNSLAVQHFLHLFGRAEVYQLPPRQGDGAHRQALARHQHGRFLFDGEASYHSLSDRLQGGATVKRTKLSDEFTFDAFIQRYANALPLFVIDASGKVSVFATDGRPKPKPGDRVIAIVPAETPAPSVPTPADVPG